MPADRKMTEAEVSIRLGLYLLRNGLSAGDVSVAIDGAQVKTGNTVHFDLPAFMAEMGCQLRGDVGWQGRYTVEGSDFDIVVHSSPGRGDVVASLRTGRRLRVESKKGTLTRSTSSQEYPLLREAIGQIMTVEDVEATDVFAVAVPHSPKFADLATRWRTAPLLNRIGIRILTVDRAGLVYGLDALAV
jgi:hypothetical protein